MLLAPKPGILYGPVSSRRLGLSLGINLLPPRTKPCTFDCRYCQYGFTRHPPQADDAFPKVDAVLSALERELRSPKVVPRFLTFSGNGEPSTHPDFPAIVAGVRALRNQLLPSAQLAILSNSTRVHDPGIREALAFLDLRIMKLDAGTEEMFRHYNRPLGDVSLDRIVAGLRALPDVTLQALFTAGPGGNSAAAHVTAWVARLADIRPLGVQIYSLDRDWPSRDLHPLGGDALASIAAQVRAAGVPATAFGPRGA